MATIIVMPRLSPTMEEGVLLKWTKKAGDKINPGDVIAEVETDKANMDFPLEEEGTLLKLLVAEGETVKLGAPVAVLGEAGEDADKAVAEAGAATATRPAAAATPKPTSTNPATPAAPPTPTIAVVPPAIPPTAAAVVAGENGQAALRASPLARKIAYEKGIDLKAVRGSGPGGRVVKRDVDLAVVPPPARAPVAAPRSLVDQLLPISPMRRTIARRLTESKATIPHYYVVRDVRADALHAFHQQTKEAAPDLNVTINDLIIKGTALALARVPEANASWGEQGIVRHGRVDIGIAVSIDDGLVTPVVRAANDKPLGTIAAEARDLIERARARKLRGDEFTGATFTISNMGMLGVRQFTAVINPPESGSLAVGALEKRAVVETGADGEERIVARRVMTVTLSADHRILDGALAARLLGEIVRILENPIAMVL